ncbi:MAG TPA: LegC family aminotransferase [Pyrinomonadaceae bacterium]|nr:LegC family aminotransferase [Pyrinomonadaceae bacterium]
MSTSFEPGALAPSGVIPLSQPEFSSNEWKYLKECLDSGWVSSAGPFVSRFEKMVSDFAGARHAIAIVNGTSALHLALLLGGVEPDDEVLVSTLTFIAPVNTIRYAGAWPVLIDAEPAHWQMDPQRVRDFLDNDCSWQDHELRNKTTGRRVRAIMPVHILGHPCDMDPLLEAARKYNLTVIEDATESLGSEYKGRKVGHLGDIGCFSFNGNKIITTGGGGMIVTDNAQWAEKAKYLSTQAKDDPIEYIHNQIGYNYRLTNIQAALGCAQMETFTDTLTKKRALAARYDAGLGDVPGLSLMRQASWASSNFWMYTILVDAKSYGEDSRALLRRLAQEDIQSRPLWQPMHQSPACRSYQVLGGEVADRLNRDALTLPCSAGLTVDDQTRVINAIRSAAR